MLRMGFKIEIFPTEEQEKILLHYCEVSHKMWNFLVAKYKDCLPITNSYGIKDYTPVDLMRDIGEDVPKRLALNVMKNYAQTVQLYTKKKGGFPKFHKFNINKQSFCLASITWKLDNNYTYMPRVGHGKAKKNLLIDDTILKERNITEVIEPHFTKYKDKWYLSGAYRVPDVSKRQDCKYLGLDWGIKNFMTTSEGEFINYPNSILREFQRINKLEHYKGKKKKGSKNYQKIKLKIDRGYIRLANLKRDFIEKKTTQISRNYNVVVEDLANHKIKTSNKKRRRLKNIAPHWIFIDKLDWKCQKYGTIFKKVSPAFTSKTCCICGKIKENLTLGDRIFSCKYCGNIIDRDVNAARNLVAMATCDSQ